MFFSWTKLNLTIFYWKHLKSTTHNYSCLNVCIKQLQTHIWTKIQTINDNKICCWKVMKMKKMGEKLYVSEFVGGWTFFKKKKLISRRLYLPENNFQKKTLYKIFLHATYINHLGSIGVIEESTELWENLIYAKMKCKHKIYRTMWKVTCHGYHFFQFISLFGDTELSRWL